MKRILTLLAFIAITVSTFAYDVCVDGLYYNLNQETQEATVTYKYINWITGMSDCQGSIVIPERITVDGVSYRVTTIGHQAFNKSSITDITLPNSLVKIEPRAFGSCSELTSMTFGNSIVEIGSYAFEYSTELKEVHITNLVAWCKSNFETNPLSVAHNLYLNGQLVQDLVIPSSVETIGTGAFQDATCITSVTIPSVQNIGNSAFAGCSNLGSVSIGNSVESIGDRAFLDCSSLTSIEIPNSVISVGWYAFWGCCNLSSVTIGNSVKSIGGGAFSECKNLSSVTIGNSVESIGDGAFSYCYNSLTSIVIPNSVVSIGSYAFQDCYQLGSVIIPNSVKSIGEYAFSYCKSLNSIEIPNSVTSIGEWAFDGCKNLASVKLSNSLSRIEDGMFCHCRSLASIDIPASVESIGWHAFGECNSLVSVDIPLSVKEIGGYAFQTCMGLTSVNISNGVEVIGDWAFHSCTNLTSVTIGNSITSIGELAFNDCYNLNDVTCLKPTPISIPEYSFKGYTWPRRLHVLSGCGEAYRNATEWKNFWEIIEDAGAEKLIESIGFGSERYKVVAGQTLKLNPQVSPTNATNKTLTWKSGNHSVATVDEQGNVTAIAPGTATILIQTTDGSHKWAWCEIDVVERLDAVPVEWLTIVNESGIEDLHTGETLQLGVELYPLGTTAEVLWESSNPDVATVDQNGLVTAVAVGVRKEMASIKAKVIGPGNPTSTRWITVSPVIPDVAQGAYLLQVEGFSHAHDLEPVQAITADGRSRMLITMDFPEYVEPEGKPILRAYNANGELLTLPEDEMGTITAMTEVKGKKGFIYKAPVNTNSVAMSNMGFYDIEVLYPLRNMDEYVSLVKFPLFRPGVLLVHGLLSDPSCFTKDDQGNNGLYEFLQDKNYGFVALVDYEDSHASAFEENSDVLNVVGNHCNAFYEELFRIGLLSSAYDFVGHSMGGILSRFYVQNHNRDAAHKIITLNTPHWGSKIANLGLLADEWYSPLNAAMETWGKAISDLGVDSEPILKLSETASQTIGIPVHAMCSYIDDYDKVYEFEVENKGSLSKYLKDYLSAFGKVAVDVSGNIADYKWWDFWTFVYGEPRWDFWVGYTSQKSGLADDYVTVFHEPATSINLETSRAHHVNCHHWEPYMFGTLNALKARVDNGHFSKYGYEPISDKYRLNTWRNDSYSNAKKRAPKAKVADGSGIQIEAVLSYEDGEHRVKISLVHEEPLVANHVYALLDESSCLSAINRDEYEFAIPNNYSGPITFNVVGKTQNDEVATASVTVDVPNMGVIEDISFSAMSNTMIEGQEKFFHVKGVWANGNYRNVEADLSSSNTDVAVIENGIVKAVAPGTFKLTAKYNGMSTSMDVNVYKKVAADESDAITSVIAKTNGEEQIYSVSGIKQGQLQNGVNIIRKADGKTVKIFR